MHYSDGMMLVCVYCMRTMSVCVEKTDWCKNLESLQRQIRVKKSLQSVTG